MSDETFLLGHVKLSFVSYKYSSRNWTTKKLAVCSKASFEQFWKWNIQRKKYMKHMKGQGNLLFKPTKYVLIGLFNIAVTSWEETFYKLKHQVT